MADKRKINPDIDTTFSTESERSKIEKSMGKAYSIINDAIGDAFKQFGYKLEEGIEDNLQYVEKGLQKGTIGIEIVKTIVNTVYKIVYSGLKKAPKDLYQTLYNDRQLTQLVYNVLHSNAKGFGHIENIARNTNIRANRSFVQSQRDIEDQILRDANRLAKEKTTYLGWGYNAHLKEQAKIRDEREWINNQTKIAVYSAKMRGQFYAPSIYKSYAPSVRSKSALPMALSNSTEWKYGSGSTPVGTGLIPQGSTGWYSHFSPTANMVPYTGSTTTNYASPLVDSPSARKLVLWGIRKLMGSLKNLPMFQVAKKATTDILRLLMLQYASNKDNPKFLRKLALAGVAFKVPESLLSILDYTFRNIVVPYAGFSMMKGFAASKGINIGNSFRESGFGKSKGVKRGFWQGIKDFFGPEQTVSTSFTKDKFGKDIIEQVIVGGGFNKLKPAFKVFGIGLLWNIALGVVDSILDSINGSVEQWIKQSGPGGTFGKKLQLSTWHGSKGALKGGLTGGLIGAIIGAIPPIIGAFFTGGATLATLPSSVMAGAAIGTKIGAGTGGLYGIWKGLATDVSAIKDNTDITKNQLQQGNWWDFIFGGGGGNPPNGGGGSIGDVISSNILDFTQPIKKGMSLGSGEYLTSLYGMRFLNGKYRNHLGIDIAPAGDAGGTWARSLLAGVVTETGVERDKKGKAKGYGGWIKITNPETGYSQLIGHVIPSDVQVGQEVKAGEEVVRRAVQNTEYIGNATKPTAHYEIYDEKGKRKDPAKFLQESQTTIKTDTTSKNDDLTHTAYVGAFTNKVITEGFAFA